MAEEDNTIDEEIFIDDSSVSLEDSDNGTEDEYKSGTETIVDYMVQTYSLLKQKNQEYL